MYNLSLTKSIKWDIATHISALITGARGSGKSFLLLSLIVMLATLPQGQNSLLGSSMIPTQIFAIDLKNSDIARLQHLLPANRVAHTKDDALKILEKFIDLMKQRLEFIQNKKPFGSTAKSLGMPAFYLIIDEWSATSATFNDAVTKEEKVQKFKWFNLMHELMMLNRQALFGVIIATQQATVTNSGLSTAIQEEVGLKIHMGNASSEAYRLTFGNDLKIPNEYLDVGEGMLWLESQNLDWVTPFAAPYINTENFWNILQKALIAQDDTKYLKLCTM